MLLNLVTVIMILVREDIAILSYLFNGTADKLLNIVV